MNSPVDISPNHLDIVLDILHKHLPVDVKVWVFGSRVDWSTKDTSDLDLALEGDSALDYSTIVALETAFEESKLPYSVDVIDLNQVSDSFRQIVDVQKAPLPLANDTTSQNENWHIVRLGDLVNVIQGCSYRSDQLQNNLSTALVTLKSFSRGGGYRKGGLKPYIGPYDEDQVVCPSDMIVARTDITQSGDVVGRPAIIPNNIPYLTLVASLDAAIIKHKPKNCLDPTFLYYRLLADDYAHHAKSYSTGTTVLHMRKDGINKFKFFLPPLDEQRSIAHVLRTLDSKIELSQRMSQTLEEMARALFKSWFIDFDPIHAKMDGRWRRGESLLGLPAEYYHIFPDRLVSAEMGEIPDGWQMKCLEDIANLNPESWSQINHPNSVEYVDLTNTKWGTIELTQHFSWESAPSRAKRVLRSGDTIIGTVRPGNGSYAFIEIDGLTASTGFAVLRPIHTWFRELVYLSVTDRDNIERLAHRADGAAYPAVQPNVVAETKILIPIINKNTLRCFSDIVNPIFSKIKIIKEASRALVGQRIALLPKLMSGELRIEQKHRK